MDRAGDHAPNRRVERHVAAMRDGELLRVILPPYDEIGGSGIERAVDHGNVAVENTAVIPLTAPDAKQKRASRALNQQLVQVQIGQTFIGSRVRKPGVHTYARRVLLVFSHDCIIALFSLWSGGETHVFPGTYGSRNVLE